MRDSPSFDLTIFLDKSSTVDFWIYSVATVELGDNAEINFSLFGVEYDRWTGSVVQVVPLPVHGRTFWLARLSVSHVKSTTAAPTSGTIGDLINVSVTITASDGSYKYGRQHLPAIVKN